MPLRTLIVNGTGPEPLTPAATMRASNRGFSGMALPPPWRVTFGTGHPKFMSMWCTPASTSERAISSTSRGSVA